MRSLTGELRNKHGFPVKLLNQYLRTPPLWSNYLSQAVFPKVSLTGFCMNSVEIYPICSSKLLPSCVIKIIIIGVVIMFRVKKKETTTPNEMSGGKGNFTFDQECVFWKANTQETESGFCFYSNSGGSCVISPLLGVDLTVLLVRYSENNYHTGPEDGLRKGSPLHGEKHDCSRLWNS